MLPTDLRRRFNLRRFVLDVQIPHMHVLLHD